MKSKDRERKREIKLHYSFDINQPEILHVVKYAHNKTKQTLNVCVKLIPFGLCAATISSNVCTMQSANNGNGPMRIKRKNIIKRRERERLCEYILSAEMLGQNNEQTNKHRLHRAQEECEVDAWLGLDGGVVGGAAGW